MDFPRFLENELSALLKHKKNILLLGPRQTGKSTLIENFLRVTKKESLVYKLQNIKIFQELVKDPTTICKAAEEILKTKSLILFIDEIQKIPILLDDCQYLIDKYKDEIEIILTGSSARKLRQKGINLLPGRLILEHLHPLILPEIFDQKEQKIIPIKVQGKKVKDLNFPLEDLLIYGSLPKILKEKKFRLRELNSYVISYLQEEIRQEALTRNLNAFSNFLELAAFESNTSPNIEKLSQETGIPASTIKNYFGILEDTLITHIIPPFRKQSRKQILTTPKYIFFDVGIRNIASKMPIDNGILNTEIGGKLFEQFIILELIKRIKYAHYNWKYFFWRTNNGLEVDFIIQTNDEIIPIEIKYTDRPQPKHIKHLQIFMDEFKCKRGFLIGTFSRAQKLTDKISAIPWNEI